MCVRLGEFFQQEGVQVGHDWRWKWIVKWRKVPGVMEELGGLLVLQGRKVTGALKRRVR